jgi:hypothetical protein
MPNPETNTAFAHVLLAYRLMSQQAIREDNIPEYWSQLLKRADASRAPNSDSSANPTSK